jgi:glucokinase
MNEFHILSCCVIDIGGTNFRCGLYRNNKLYGIKKIATPNFLQYNNKRDIQRKLIETIIQSYFEKKKEYKNISKIGIAFPGPTNAKGDAIGSSVIFGKALQSPFKIKEQVKFELRKRGVNVDVLVVNDMTASAWRYSDMNYDPFCLITVSSGIGNKIFSNGNVLIDKKGITGEIGHFEVNINEISIPCTCGCGKNHVGMISSGRGIEYFAKLFAQEGGKYRDFFIASNLAKDKKINKDKENITNELIAKYADKNDPFTKLIIDYCTEPLANCICLLSLALYLKKIILIGGFALNCNYYLESLKNNVIKKGIYNYSIDEIRNLIILGERDDDHALKGLGKMLTRDKKLLK